MGSPQAAWASLGSEALRVVSLLIPFWSQGPNSVHGPFLPSSSSSLPIHKRGCSLTKGVCWGVSRPALWMEGAQEPLWTEK